MRKKKSALQKRKGDPRSSYWKKKADRLWGLVIHAGNDRCAVNNGECAGNLEAHHLISRANVTLRHKRVNGILLCSLHHKFSKHLSPHGAPLAFAEWMMMERPEQWQWASENKYRADIKPDYEAAYNDLMEWCRLEGIELT